LGRHYHTLEHLSACLRELDGSRNLALRPAEVEMALWFHDAVYRSWRRDNEARSAEQVERILRGAPPDALGRIRRMILDTRHGADVPQGDSALVSDIDLAILGKPADGYARFAEGVRREYWWVLHRRYVAGRCAVLEGFLARDAIYRLEPFRARYEQRARANLEAEIQALRRGT
jgi:predicted metal-dependent HD superfamily phosphohydrolase